MKLGALGMLLAGLVGGFGVGWLATTLVDVAPPDVVAPPPPAATQPALPEIPDAPSDAPAAKDASAARPPPAAPAANRAAPVARATPERQAPAPRSVEERAASLADQLRDRSAKTIDRAESSAYEAVLHALRVEHRGLEKLGDDAHDPVKLLRALDRTWFAPYALVGTPQRFEAMFQRKGSGRTVAVPTRRPRKQDGPPWAQGDTIGIRAGVAALDPRWVKPLPQDLLFQGAGMDHTLLVLEQELGGRDGLRSLAFRDMTIHCNDRGFLDFSRGLVVRLERCRIVGFGNDLFEGRRGAMVHAIDCEFDARFERGREDLFARGGAILARFENCRFAGSFGKLAPNRDALVLFARCRFEDMPKPRRALRTALFVDCDLRYLDGGQQPKHRKLHQINRTWRLP